MDWNQVCIETTEHAADIVSSILIDAGTGGVEIEGGSASLAKHDEYNASFAASGNITVKGYYGEYGFSNVLLYIEEHINYLKHNAKVDAGSLQIRINKVKDTDWNEEFKKQFTSFRAAGRIVIKPTWENYQRKDGDIVIEIDPGMAFGSGIHETTKMCLELIQKYMPENADVLDVGCGSGILGIACAKLGARKVLSLDTDSVSVKVTKDNALANGAGTLECRQSDLLVNAEKKEYDLIVANIVADVIIRLNKDAPKHMKKGAVYIISGIIEERLDEVKISLEKNGLTAIETLSMGDWRAIAARLKGKEY